VLILHAAALVDVASYGWCNGAGSKLS